jgi:hypothetical protein
VPVKSKWKVAVPIAVAAAAAGAAFVPTFGGASSHREAPAISQDPTADSTDVYAFRNVDDPATKGDESQTASLVANYIPFQEPAGGPNFYRFSDQAKYEITVDNTGDGRGDVSYEFRFKTRLQNPDTFLYNTGPISFDEREGYQNFNLQQTYSVRKITRDARGRLVARTVGRDLITPPNNVGPRSTPDYESLARPAVQTLADGTRVFAGQRDDPFFVDLGSIFDLLAFRQAPPEGFMTGGYDALQVYSVNTIAIQVPIKHLTRKGNVPTDLNSTDSVVGVYTAASRPVVTFPGKGRGAPQTRWQQVSRLGNPLVNEVIIPLGQKDRWNASDPSDDAQFERFYLKPELAAVANSLYKLGSPTEGRKDLSAILLTGIPPNNGLGLPTTQIGKRPAKADLARINLAAPATPVAEQNRLGLLAGQLDGHPNGRRLTDDVVDIAERAVAGVLAAPFGVPAPNGENAALVPLLGDGVNANDKAFSDVFPHLATPTSGFNSRVNGNQP